MADGSYPNRLSPVGQLVDAPIGADPQRVQAAELPPERIPSEPFTLEQAQRILDRIDQRPVQLEQVATSSPGEDEAGQRSAGCRPALR